MKKAIQIKKYVLLLGIGIIILQSCTEPIDIELDSTYSRLVVWGAITTDTTQHSVTLSRSADYFIDGPSPPISGASVTISDGERNFVLLENDTVPGLYQTSTDVYGIPNRTYKLAISNVDIDEDGEMESYFAESRLNPVNSIDSIQVVYKEYYQGFDGWEIRLFAWDSPQRDVYLFRALKNGVMMSDTLTEWQFESDEFFNGKYTNGITTYVLSGTKEEERLVPGDEVTFEVAGITEDYMSFLIECFVEYFPSIPLFSGPPANIRTNVSGGAVGYFAAYSIERASRVYQGEGLDK
jgi:hypothetical protein